MISETGQMDLSALIRDNIDDILIKIIQFTRIRHRVISDNIKNCHTAGFVPKCIDVEDFARTISVALAEHQKSQRLLLCDSATVSFFGGGQLNIEPQVDGHAQRLFNESFDKYINLQKQRLNENAVNNKTACALLGYKKKTARMTA